MHFQQQCRWIDRKFEMVTDPADCRITQPHVRKQPAPSRIVSSHGGCWGSVVEGGPAKRRANSEETKRKACSEGPKQRVQVKIKKSKPRPLCEGYRPQPKDTWGWKGPWTVVLTSQHPKFYVFWVALFLLPNSIVQHIRSMYSLESRKL